MRHLDGIVVIGGGIVGCAIAAELTRRGSAVTLVEARGIGLGASQASAGILGPFLEANEAGPFLDLAVRSLGLFDEFVARTRADACRSGDKTSAPPIHYDRAGILEVALDEAEARRLRQRAELLAGAGISAEPLDQAAARRAEPQLSQEVAGALAVPQQGCVAAGALTRALAQAARRHGAAFIEGRARRLSAEAGGVRIELEDEVLTAARVVLAAGSWSGLIECERPPALPVRPVRGQLLALAWNLAPMRRVLWGARCYLVPWQDGTLLVGATVEDAGFEERATVTGVHDLMTAACELVPRAWQAGFLGVRVGLRPAAPDELPIVGCSSRIGGLTYATAHYRNGVLLAPITATLVADLLLDGRRDAALDALSPQRFGDL